MRITLKLLGGDIYEIPFAAGWTRFGAIRFALCLTGATKATLEWFRID